MQKGLEIRDDTVLEAEIGWVGPLLRPSFCEVWMDVLSAQ